MSTRRSSHPRRGSTPGASRGTSAPERRESLLRALYIATVVVVFALAAHGLWRKITWYLAIDQSGYATFAGDLAEGRLFHRWPPVEILAPNIPFDRVDVRAQTYVFAKDREQRMYCRYTPGFPILLAGWIKLFGRDAIHTIDPTCFLVLMALHLTLARRLLQATPGGRWLALGGTLFLLLLPSHLHLWAITLLRDLSAQNVALGAILLALPRSEPFSKARTAAIGGLLGYLVCIRIDAILYALPIGLLFLWRLADDRRLAPERYPRAAVALGGIAVAFSVIGVSPLLIYNYASTGNPFHATQAMEVESFFETSRRAPDPDEHVDQLAATTNALELEDDDTARLGAAPPVPSRKFTQPPIHGGGLRFSNLKQTLPGNWQYVRDTFGSVLLPLAALGAVVSLSVNRRLFVVTIPYVLASLIFYSFWSRPDPRYIAGIFVLTPLLTLAGLDGLARLGGWARSAAGPAMGTGLTLVVAAALAWAWGTEISEALRIAAAAWSTGSWEGGSALPVVGGAVAVLAVAVAASSAFAGPTDKRIAWPGALLVGVLLSIALSRALPAWNRYASFQSEQVAIARSNIEALVEPGGIVLTTDEVGRPAENIDHYTHAYALYLDDLDRWRQPLHKACLAFLDAGHAVYLLAATPSPQGQRALETLQLFSLTHLAHIEAQDAPAYFVASRFGTYPLDLHRIELPRLRQMFEWRRRQRLDAPAGGKPPPAP